MKKPFCITGMLPFSLSAWLTDEEAEMLKSKGCTVNIESLACKARDDLWVMVTPENQFRLEDKDLTQVPVRVEPEDMPIGCEEPEPRWTAPEQRLWCPRCGGRSFKVRSRTAGIFHAYSGEAEETAQVTLMECVQCNMRIKA